MLEKHRITGYRAVNREEAPPLRPGAHHPNVPAFLPAAG
jgi:hypothetical protein